VNEQALQNDMPASSHFAGTHSGHPLVGDHDAIFHKVTARFLPLLFLCYVFNYLDRTNIGFAQLQMKGDLGFSDVAYGLGASAFFVSYALFQLPSNLITATVGARRTIFVSCVSWGLISAGTMFIHTPNQFYFARFCLGVVEAGFFPGVVFFFTKWYPSYRRAKVTGIFLSATVVSGIVSGVVSGSIMTYLNKYRGLQGWQWMFLVEGLPAIILGTIAYFRLDDEPASADWLSDQEKKIILETIERDRAQNVDLKKTLFDWRVYLLGLLYFLGVIETFILAFWQPAMIKAFGVSSLISIGLLSTIPAAVSVVAKIFAGHHSDLKREVRWHYAVPAIMGAIAFTTLNFFPHNALGGMISLTLAAAGAHATIPIVFAAPGRYWSGKAAAGAIAIISSIGTLSGAVGPSLIGLLKTDTGGFAVGNYIQSAFLVVGAVLMLTLISEARDVPHTVGETESVSIHPTSNSIR
jgi:MFS family permease